MTSTYRRKQDAILGLDNSNLASPSDTLANAVARYETGELDGRRSEVNENAASISRMENSRDYARSLYESHTNIDRDFDDVSDLEDSDEEEMRATRIPTKANQLLGLGYHDSRNKRLERSGGISTKTQRLLGLSKALKVVPVTSPHRYQTLQSASSDTDSIAPKALRTLGIQSNQRSRPNDSSSSQSTPIDAETFGKLLLSGQRPQQVDNKSNTDVSSSLSRESTISWKTETPRSSQEVHREDTRWRNRPTVFTKRLDSLVNPSAVLTEPFSPLSAVDNPWNKALPEPPNNLIFELPADMPPPPRYSVGQSNFIAELPADTQFQPVYELSALEPEIAELPGVPAESSAAKKKISGYGITHSPPIDSQSHSSDEKFTREAGISASGKPSLIPQRNMTAPTRSKISERSSSGKQAGRVPPISTDVGRGSAKPFTSVGSRSYQENTIIRDHNDHGQETSYRDDFPRSRFTEFEMQSSPMSMNSASPISPSSGLGRIAAKVAVGRRWHDSLTEEQRGKSRSKYSQILHSIERDLSSEIMSSTTKETEQVHDSQKTEPENETATRKTSPSDEHPESPVIGYMTGQPPVNR